MKADADPHSYSGQSIFSKLLFLTFADWWTYMVVVTTILNFSMNWARFTFGGDQFYNMNVNYFYYSCEFLYFANVVGLIAHKCLPKKRRHRMEQPAHSFILFLDVLSLMPIYELQYFLQLHSWDHTDPIDFYRVKVSLRLIFVMYFFKIKSNSVGINHRLLLIVKHIILLIVVTVILSCVWYLFACYNCGYQNWTVLIPSDVVDVNNTLNWFIISHYICSSTLAHNWPSSLPGAFDKEWIFISCVMIIGLTVHIMIFFGELIGSMSHYQAYQFNFTTRIRKTLSQLQDWEIKPNIQKRVIEYYHYFSEKRQGEKSIPAAFYLLPRSLQKAVTLDVFWDTLRHSHLLNNTDISFKRAISMVMRSEFKLPGDYIYRTGELNSTMYYIVSGVVQVLSYEDNESPYLSLSTGTLLGEVAAFTPLPCNATVKCATYCEFHCLNARALTDVLGANKAAAKELFEQLKKRINIAKELRNKVTWADDGDVNRNDKSMRRFKYQWRALYALHTNKKHDAEEKLRAQLDKSFYSEYLDCIVMSEEVELKIKAICLTSQCPLIMEPRSSFRQFCEWITLTGVIIQFVIIPKVAFFSNDPNSLAITFLILDLFYYIDIYLQLTTAINYQSKIISKFRDIFFHKIVQLSFIVDLVASLPYSIVLTYLKMYEWSVIAQMARLLKIYKLFVLIDDKLKNPFQRKLYLKVLQHVLLHLVVIYIAATLMYATDCFRNDCDPSGWYVMYDCHTDKSFAMSIFHTSSVYLGIGVSDVVSYTVRNIIITDILIYLGYFLIVVSVADVTATAVLNVRKAYAHQDEIQIMDHLMMRRNIGTKLRKRLKAILNFNWQLNEGMELLGPQGLLNFSAKLKHATYTERIIETLKLAPLFQACEDRVIECCAQNAKISILPPGTYLTNVGVMPMTMYVIVRGKCSMMSDLPGDRERKRVLTMERGGLLAPLAMLHRIKGVVTIQTITAVEVLEMPYEIFFDIVRSHPSTYNPIREVLNEHLEKFQNTLHKKGCRLPRMYAEQRAIGGVDAFAYTIFPRKSFTIDEYTKPFLELKHWSWLRYLLLRSTIDPKKKFFVCWEVFRITTILVDFTIALLGANVLADQLTLCNWISMAYCVLSGVDVYIRLHCQYYNEYGIIVTHPLSTAKHYIRCSFPIDILQTLPHFILESAYLFGELNIVQTQVMLKGSIRFLAIYRFYQAVTYLESLVSWSWGAIIIRAKFTVFLILVLLLTSNILIMSTCDYIKVGPNMFNINCTGDNWAATVITTDESERGGLIFLKAIYYTVSTYANCICLPFNVGCGEWNINIFTVFLTAMRWVVLSGFTSCITGGSSNLSAYQSRMKQFIKFAKQVRLQPHLVTEIITHNEMVWSQTQGSNVIDICSKFNNFLRTQFISFLYESTLRTTSMMINSSSPFLLAVAQQLNEMHFKAGAHIIRCNDVQGYMYIVHTGEADVSVAKCDLARLTRGSVFGCFSNAHSDRQLITVQAMENVTVLAIKSQEFHKLLQYWGNEPAEDVINTLLSTRQEYAESLLCAIRPDARYRRYIRTIKPFSQQYHRYLHHFNRFCTKWAKWFKLWKYLLYVHISFISSTASLLNLCVRHKEPTTTIPLILFSITDVIYVWNLIVGFNEYYVDPYTGVLHRIGKTIAIRYLKSWFTFDLLMCFPFEQLGRAFFQSSPKFLGVNRIFRYYYLVHYYNKCNEKLSVSRHLLWTYLLYKAIFYVQVAADFWLLLVCDGHSCKYLTYNGTTTSIAETETSFQAVIVAYTFMINQFSATSLRAVAPMTVISIAVSLCTSFLVQYIMASLVSGFATLLMIENSTMMQYHHDVQILRRYLKIRDLSPAILQMVWEYLIHLWKIQRGEWVPKALNDAPSYLKEEIMQSLYMSHIENHFLFANTHVDFLRQLVTHLQRCVYLPGNYIIEAGDQDSAIYFVHKGEVAAYSINGDDEIQCYILSANMSFGEAQGLTQMPYQHSYKAVTLTEVLILKKHSWDYLVRRFPASRDTIKEKSADYGMLYESSYSDLFMRDKQRQSVDISFV